MKLLWATMFVLACYSPALPLLAQQESPKCPAPTEIQDAKYKPGQVWSYKTRRGEDSSTITILRVESLPRLGIIVHIRIDGIHLKNCSGGPSPIHIGHAPFTKAALDGSTLKLLREDVPLPAFEEGYNDWRSHCGGAYTISVADVVKADELTFNSGVSCSE